MSGRLAVGTSLVSYRWLVTYLRPTKTNKRNTHPHAPHANNTKHKNEDDHDIEAALLCSISSSMQDPPRPPANRIDAWTLRKRLGGPDRWLPPPVLVVLTRDARGCIFEDITIHRSRHGQNHHATATLGSLGRTQSRIRSLEARGVAG